MPHPTSIDLIFLELLPVSAGTSYGPELRKVVVHPTHAKGGVYPKGGKTRSDGWSLNYIREEHDPGQAWKSFTISLDLLPATVGTDS